MTNNIIIIGSSHIARQSLLQVEETILKERPDFVAIELDRKRFAGLISGKREELGWEHVKRFGLKGFLFNLIGGWVERKLGKLVGVKPGSEMLIAFKTAKKVGAKIALIDQDIEVTMRKFSKAFGWKDRWHLFKDLFMSIFFRKREMKKLGIKNLDLSKVPPKKLIEKLIKRVKKDYPGVYKVLIDERNKYMAQQLIDLEFRNPGKKIIAVVGAGHEEGIKELLKKKNRITFSYSVG
ncbi:TraB domain-containing protein [Candidatus Woesearchaeota archaeon]|nr:TraB domain-containing protein [Candidatus Woesearchaeota archaeon]